MNIDKANLKALAQACDQGKWYTEEQLNFRAVDGPDGAFVAAMSPAAVLGLIADAERYRWLRDKSESVHQFYLSTSIFLTGVKFSKDNVDATIDAAMAWEADQCPKSSS